MEKYDGIIKDTAAFRQLLASHAQAYLICGDYIAAKRLAQLFIQHECGFMDCADIMVLPEGERVLADDIDFLIKTAHFTPLKLRNKYYIIEKGETLNDTAANRLLKILEEPPNAVKIIILSESDMAILPTIRSRCRMVSIAPFSEKALDEIIDKYYLDSENASLAREISLGSIGRLERAIKGEYNTAAELASEILIFMRKSPQILAFSKKILQNKAQLGDIIDMLELFLHKSMLFRLNANCNIGYGRKDIEQISEFYGVETILRLKEAFGKARDRLRFNGNINSVVDELLFGLLQIRQRVEG